MSQVELYEHELFRFERIGKPGYGSIGCEDGKWYLFATDGVDGKSKWLPSKEAAESVAAKIRSNPAQFKVITDKGAI